MTSKHASIFLIFAITLAATREGWPQVQEDPAAAKAAPTAVRRGYVGDVACVTCHREQSLSYTHTAHHLTSQPANDKTVLGNLHPPGNVLTISDPKKSPSQPALYFKTEMKGDTIVQTAVTGWGDQLLSRSEQLDVVTGSGVRGQTYLYWQGDRLLDRKSVV